MGSLKKKVSTRRIILLLCILLFIPLTGLIVIKIWLQYQWGEGPKAPDLSALDTRKWDETIYKLVPPPTENGNAMDYFMQATHNRIRSPARSRWAQGNTNMPYSWWARASNIDFSSEDPAIKALINEAIQISELDLMVEGSNQIYYFWFGSLIKTLPQETQPYFLIGEPPFLEMRTLVLILQARANSKKAKGDFLGAESDLLAAIRIGHQMQRDITTLGFIIGLQTELVISKEMPEFYKAMGNNAKGKEWEIILPQLEKRRKVIREFMEFIIELPKQTDLQNIVENENLPRAIRIESLIHMYSPVLYARNPWTIVMGMSRGYKEFILQDHFNDPEAALLQLTLIEDIYHGYHSKISNRLPF